MMSFLMFAKKGGLGGVNESPSFSFSLMVLCVIELLEEAEEEGLFKMVSEVTSIGGWIDGEDTREGITIVIQLRSERD